MTTEPQIHATMPPGSVIITPAQMYAELAEMGKKLDHLAAIVDPAFKDIRDDVSDHESRIRSVEKRIYYIGGGVLVSAAAISYFMPLLTR